MTLDVARHGSTARCIARTWALNEARVEKASRERMLEVVVEVDGRPLSRWGCDGVVVRDAHRVDRVRVLRRRAGGVAGGRGAAGRADQRARAVRAPAGRRADSACVAVEVLPDTPGGVLWCDGRRSVDLPPGRAGRGARAAPRRCGWPALHARAVHRPAGARSSTCRSRLARQRRADGWNGVGPCSRRSASAGLGVIDDAVLEPHAGPDRRSPARPAPARPWCVTGLGLLFGGRADAGARPRRAPTGGGRGPARVAAPGTAARPRADARRRARRRRRCCSPARSRPRAASRALRRRPVGAGLGARPSSPTTSSRCTARATSSGCCSRPGSATRSTASPATGRRAAAPRTARRTSGCARSRRELARGQHPRPGARAGGRPAAPRALAEVEAVDPQPGEDGDAARRGRPAGPRRRAARRRASWRTRRCTARRRTPATTPTRSRCWPRPARALEAAARARRGARAGSPTGSRRSAALVADVAADLASYADGVEADPARLARGAGPAGRADRADPQVRRQTSTRCWRGRSGRAPGCSSSTATTSGSPRCARARRGCAPSSRLARGAAPGRPGGRRRAVRRGRDRRAGRWRCLADAGSAQRRSSRCRSPVAGPRPFGPHGVDDVELLLAPHAGRAGRGRWPRARRAASCRA